MWNSGMMLRQVSAGLNARAAAMCRAEAARLPLVNGTILGRAVVPEVCSTKAGSSGRGGSAEASPEGRAEASRVNAPAAPWPGCRVSTGSCKRLATSFAGPLSSAASRMAAGCRSCR